MLKRRTEWQRRPLGLVTAVACLVSGSRAAAQQELPPYRLGEVVVSADGPVSESAATLRVVTAEQIEASGARTLDEVLALLPGLDIRTGGQGVARIDYRGFRPRHTLLLIDGIPFNAAWDGQADPSLIPLENVASIKVVPGTGSVLYGEGGLGAVINVITKRASAGPTGSAGAEVREANGALVRATGGAGSARIGFFASGSHLDSGGFLSTPTSPTLTNGTERSLRTNSDQRRTNLFGNVTGTLTPRLEFGLTAMYVDAAYGIPPGVIEDPSDPFASRVTYDRMEAHEGLAAQLAFAWQPAATFAMRSWAYVNRLEQNPQRYDDATYSTMDDPLVRGTFDEHNRTNMSGASTQLLFTPRNLGRFTIGLSTARDSWTIDLLVRDVAAGGGGAGGGGGGGSGGGGAARFDTRTVRDDRTLRRSGLALEYEVRPVRNGGLTLGWSRHWQVKDGSGTDAASAALAGAYYEIGATRLRAAVARRFHFPTVRQLYEIDGGNPELRTERATIYEAGIERSLGSKAQAGLIFFSNDADDYIERPGQGEPFENFQAYRFRGAELSIATVWPERLHLRASYTFLDTEDRSAGAARLELQYRPRHRIAVDADYAFPFRLRARAAIRHVSGQVYTARRDVTERERLPAYTVTDVRLSRRFLEDRFQASVGIDNAFDTAYEEQYGNPRPTRTLYASIGLSW